MEIHYAVCCAPHSSVGTKNPKSRKDLKNFFLASSEFYYTEIRWFSQALYITRLWQHFVGIMFGNLSSVEYATYKCIIPISVRSCARILLEFLQLFNGQQLGFWSFLLVRIRYVRMYILYNSYKHIWVAFWSEYRSGCPWFTVCEFSWILLLWRITFFWANYLNIKSTFHAKSLSSLLLKILK